MIQNYTGETVHLRQLDGTLLTLLARRGQRASICSIRVLAGEEESCRMPLVHQRELIRGLPDPNYAGEDTYLVSEAVLAVARAQERTDCFALDPASAAPLPCGPIAGVGKEHSLLLTPYDWGDAAATKSGKTSATFVLSRRWGFEQ